MSNITSLTSQERRQAMEEVIECAEWLEANARSCIDPAPDATLRNDPAEQFSQRPAASNVGAAHTLRVSSATAYRESLAAADPTVITFAHKLANLDAAVWSASPGGDEFQRPHAWQKLEPRESASRIANARPGDALCANMGGRVAVVDVDPRNKGDIEGVRALLSHLDVTVFAEVGTPGGGKHFYIAGHADLPSTRDLDGFPGVDIQSSGTNVFLPGTRRPKYDGGGYTIVIDQLEHLASGGDEEGAAGFAAWIVEHRTAPNQRSATPAPLWNGDAPDKRQQKYLDTVLINQSAAIAEAEPGVRNNVLYEAALKCGSFIAGAGMEESAAIAALVAAAEECGLTYDDGGQRQVNDTIRSGLANGKKNPHAVPEPGSAAEDPHHLDADGRQRLEDSYIGEHIALEYLVGKFLYCGAFGWMQFDRGRWSSAGEEMVREEIRLGVKDFHHKEVDAGADVARLKKISGLFSASKLNAILTIAQGFLSLVDPGFDQHPDLLNFRNGVLDLRDGILRPHDPALRFTKVVPANYNPEAVHEDWEKALTALPDDVVDWLQVRLGQGITGHPTPDDRMVILKGEGANGKTTLVDSVWEAMGPDFAVTMPDRVLLANTGDHPTELMILRGARLAFMEELPELGNLNVKRLKDTHGTGRISARLIRKDTVTFPVTHSMFVTTNYLPRVTETDHGTWRRLALVNFPYQYSNNGAAAGMDREGDPGLIDRLRRGDGGRREAVLAWLVQGSMRWYENGKVFPDPPESVLADTRRWRASADVLLRYIDDSLEFTLDSHVLATELYADFAEWLKENGLPQWSDQMFSAKFGGHREVQAAAVEKKRGVRRSQPGLSRRDEASTEVGPAQYVAWLGVRFRAENDDGDGR